MLNIPDRKTIALLAATTLPTFTLSDTQGSQIESLKPPAAQDSDLSDAELGLPPELREGLKKSFDQVFKFVDDYYRTLPQELRRGDLSEENFRKRMEIINDSFDAKWSVLGAEGHRHSTLIQIKVLGVELLEMRKSMEAYMNFPEIFEYMQGVVSTEKKKPDANKDLIRSVEKYLDIANKAFLAGKPSEVLSAIDIMTETIEGTEETMAIEVNPNSGGGDLVSAMNMLAALTATGALVCGGLLLKNSHSKRARP